MCPVYLFELPIYAGHPVFDEIRTWLKKENDGRTQGKLKLFANGEFC